MNILKYGRWDGDRFVFEPPLLRQGIVVDNVDFRTTPLPDGMSREDVVAAVLRGRVGFIPAEPPTADMFAFADGTRAQFAQVYTGAHTVPGAVKIQCVVCGRSGQTTNAPPDVVLCSQPCLDRFTADPQRYLGDAPETDVAKGEFHLKVLMCMPVDLTRVPEEHKRTYAALAEEGAQLRMRYYPGSIVDQCVDCGTDVFVGPRQQAALADDPSMQVLCPVCCAIIQAEAMMVDGDVTVSEMDLGNGAGIPRSY